ncbi:antibiotic biosynthesis monooxygenase [Ancylothrix sp. C2]|uniref:putative quinol monooxygenase n=1 Tax=Ancylothrix sp. D3o TaxID=2953691 RepID=UPI0021BBA90C|nr:putative quinol monooxygenase [Ancylothrix sp. D3o]MCT7949679.1 antibiotic biosynthesis monooxygenase [Ancylothrix sp. D3o]
MNNQSKLRVVAKVVALPDKIEELKTILIELLEPTRKETGCIFYDLMQNQTNPAEFVFVEEWESEADLQAHLTSDHIQEALIKCRNLVENLPDIRSYQLID